MRLRVAQQDDAVVAGDEVEGDLENPREQLVEVALEADVVGELVADAQPLVVALELVDVADLLDRREGRLGRGARDHALQLFLAVVAVDDLGVLRLGDAAEPELHLGGADDDFVAVLQLGGPEDALAVEESAVGGAEVAKDVVVAFLVDLAVLARDLAVGEPDRGGGAAAENVVLAERKLGDVPGGTLEDHPRSGVWRGGLLGHCARWRLLVCAEGSHDGRIYLTTRTQ